MRIFLTVLTLVFLAAPVMAKEEETVFDHVMKTGTIRCGYAVWYPILYHDLNAGKIVGIMPEFMEAIGDKLSLKIEWAEEASYGTIVEGLATKRYDMICAGLYMNAARALRIDFSRPYFYSPLLAVVRTEEDRFKTYEDLDNPDIKIGVQEGEAGSMYARQNYPQAQFVAISQISDFSQLYEEVAHGKTDVAMAEMSSYNQYNEKNPGKVRLLTKDPASVYPVVLGLPQGDVRLKTAIDAAVTELIHDGTINRLMKKHLDGPNLFLPVADPYKGE